MGERTVCDWDHRCFNLGGSAERFGDLQVGGTDEEDVAFLPALKSLHGVYVVVCALALRADVEFLEQGFDDNSAADRAA